MSRVSVEPRTGPVPGGRRRTERHVFRIGCLAVALVAAACFPAQRQRAAETAASALAETAAPAAETVRSAPSPDWGRQEAGEDPQAKSVPVSPQPRLQQRRSRIRELGDSRFFRSDVPARPAVEEEGDVTLNFQDVDLREFVHVVLGDMLKLNFVIDPKVSGGRVSIETSRPFRREQLLPLLEDVLAMNGVVLVEKSGLYKLLPRAQAAVGNVVPEVRELGSDASGYRVRIIPLQFVSAREIQEIMQPFLSDQLNLRIDEQRNLVIAAGTSDELRLLQETIDIFDVDWMKGMSIGLYPLEYADPKAIQRDLQAVLSGPQERGDSLLKGLVRTVAIERLNSILLIGSTASSLREAELWLYRLDRPGERIGRRLYVYPVQNAKAVDLAEILNKIFTRSDAERRGELEAPTLAPGTVPVEIAGEEDEPPTETPPVPALTEAGVALAAAGDIEIIADDTRNALVILAGEQDYKMVEAAIRKLDTVPLQVLVQAGIVEVTLNEDLEYGVEWFLRNQAFDDYEGRFVQDLGEPGLSALVGLSYSIVDSADRVRLAVNALAGRTEVNILSNPSLMVLDNQTAMINVGDEIPVPTRQSISNVDPDAPTVNEIEFRKTGVSLSVTPRVNDGGLVTMEIKQAVSDAVATDTSTLNAPTIQQREIESVIAINSGDTLVMGGLIRNRVQDGEGGVPGLKDLPVIGKLFAATDYEVRRTELLVLITPRVVRNREDARGITDELRRKIRAPMVLPEALPEVPSTAPSDVPG